MNLVYLHTNRNSITTQILIIIIDLSLRRNELVGDSGSLGDRTLSTKEESNKLSPNRSSQLITS